MHEDIDVGFMLKYLAMTGNAGGELEDYMPTPKGTTTLHSQVTNEHPG